MNEPYDYSYQQQDDYCYPNTKILINRLELKDKAALHDAERNITYLRTVELQKHPVKGRYDFNHLKAVHRFIFGDIYAWAGESRRGEFLSKGDTFFCRGQFIDSMAAKTFESLKAENKLRGLEKGNFTKRLAYYMGEVNALHPFREGNGRASREFFRQLSKSAGYNLSFANVDKAALLAADIQAFDRNYELLISILDDSSSKITRQKDKDIER